MTRQARGTLTGSDAAEAIFGVIANAEGRCKCGAAQPDDVNWAAYEIEVENTLTGEQAVSAIVVCPLCEQALDAAGRSQE